jgi:hypothetical protein
MRTPFLPPSLIVTLSILTFFTVLTVLTFNNKTIGLGGLGVSQ